MSSRRKALRSSLVSYAITNMTMLQVIYPSMPKEFEGQSPVLVIESMGGDLPGTPVEGETVGIALSSWVIRTDTNDAEDLLDDIREAIKEMILTEYNGEFIQASEADYLEIDGLDYRVEFFYVRIFIP